MAAYFLFLPWCALTFGRADEDTGCPIEETKENQPLGRYFTSLVVLAALYFPIRLMHEYWIKLSLPRWCVYIAGFLSWGVILSLAGPVYAIGSVCAAVIDHPNEGTALEAVVLIFLTGLIINTVIVHTEILDWANVKSFLRASLFFRNYFAEHEDLFVQLEKKKIRDIHRENSGEEIPDSINMKKDFPHTDPASARRELEMFRSKPLQSLHLKDELGELRNGGTVDISDTFAINVLKRPTNALYQHCRELRINADSRTLAFKVNFTTVTVETIIDVERMFRVKQHLYDLLQALVSEEWLKPYAEFFDTISVTCFRVQMDGFDLPQQFPFLTVAIPIRELVAREGKIFSVADLHTIATVTIHG